MNTQKNVSKRIYEEVSMNIREEMDRICMEFFSSFEDMLVCLRASVQVKAAQYVQEQFRKERETKKRGANAARSKRPAKRRV